MVSYHGKDPVCLKVGQKLICNKENIDGVQADQQATYSPSDQISLDYRPDCRGGLVKICVLQNVHFKIPHVYYHEDACFSNNAKGGKWSQNSTSWSKHFLNVDQDQYLVDDNGVRLCLSDQIAVTCKTPKLDTNPFVSSTISSTAEKSCDGPYGHSRDSGSGT